MSVSVFAERLRNAMNSRGLKQVDLVHAAEHRGVKMGKSHISQYVAGKTMPREDVLEFLASELDVDMNWLRGEESTTQLNSDAPTASRTANTPPHRLPRVPPSPRRTARFPWAAAAPSANRTSSTTCSTTCAARSPTRRCAWSQRHPHPEIEHRQPGTLRLPHAGRSLYDMAHQLTDTEATRRPRACSPRARPSCSTRS